MAQEWQRPRSKSLWLALILAGLIALTVPRSASAARPQARIEELLDAASAVLDDPRLQGPGTEVERQERVRKIIHDMLAFEEMAREALGTNWARLTPQQQIRNLALTLYAIIVERYDVAEPQAVCDRCVRACQARGLEPAAAVIISGPPCPPDTASVTRWRACRKFPGVRQLGDAPCHPGGVTLAGTADAA